MQDLEERDHIGTQKSLQVANLIFFLLLFKSNTYTNHFVQKKGGIEREKLF